MRNERVNTIEDDIKVYLSRIPNNRVSKDSFDILTKSTFDKIAKSIDLATETKFFEKKTKEPPLIKIVTGSVNYTNYYNLYYGEPQSLSTNSIFIEVMDVIHSLRNEIKGISREQKCMSEKLEGLSKLISPRSNENIVVFFRNRDQFQKEILQFFDENNIDYEMRGGGVIITSEYNESLFKKMGYDYVVARSMSELYEKYEEDINKYTSQIRGAYGITTER